MVGWGQLNDGLKPAWILGFNLSAFVLFPRLFPRFTFAIPTKRTAIKELLFIQVLESTGSLTIFLIQKPPNPSIKINPATLTATGLASFSICQ